MTIVTQIRAGAYYDSVVLMQLQRALAALPGVEEAGVVMGTAANKELLAESNLLDSEARGAAAEDLIIAVRSADSAAAQSAIDQVDALLVRKSSIGDNEYRPKTIDAARKLLPEARWALVSTPGRYAAGVARDALGHGLNVFLYSDNVTLEDEVALKAQAASKGLLVMGPDCGTAIVNGVGLGFANRVRRGSIGIVGASGTGLQYVTSRIHERGAGITHALGTGGRDLSDAVGAATALQSLDLLRRDPETRVLVIISKPPSAAVAQKLLNAARAAGKPTVVHFIGYTTARTDPGDLLFASSLDECAELAVMLSESNESHAAETPSYRRKGYLRGLFSGGTLAYEAQILLRDHLAEIWSNAPLGKMQKLPNSLHSQGHSIVDLGEDEFTVGRLHPMLDNELRIKRLLQEAADPETGAILLDVVLGYGAHPDPAAELAPVIQRAKRIANEAGRDLPVVALLVGTDEDPQDWDRQRELLAEAGALVYSRSSNAILAAAEFVTPGKIATPVDLATIHQPLTAINIGLESFADALKAQGAQHIHVEWKPPAAGNERLMGILERMKKK